MAAEQASATALRQLNNDPRKCAICQKKTKDRLVTQHADSSKTNLFNYAVAKDDADIVQLINEHREDVTWHRNCYAVYTSKSHIQTDKRSTDAVSSGEDAVRDCKRQRSVVTCNVNQCLFCEKTYHGREKLIKVATLQMSSTVRYAANSRGDNKMLAFLTTVGNDLVAADAVYHKSCLAAYLNAAKAAVKAPMKQSVFDETFCDLIAIISPKIKNGHCYSMNDLLNTFKDMLAKGGAESPGFTKHKLKSKLMNSKIGRELTFTQFTANESEAVYSKDIRIQDILNACEKTGDFVRNEEQNADHDSEKAILRKAALILKRNIQEVESISIQPLELSDIALDPMQSHIPQNLYQFILDMLCGAENSSEIPEHIRLRCISVALDLIYCASKSRTKTAKHVALAITIKKLTGSKELIQILNRWGHSISYDDFLAAQTSLAIEQVAKQELVLNVPPDITPGIFCQMAADNNDINEHTLDGQNTTHATTMVVFQKGVFGPIPKQRVLATHNKKQRSLSNNAPRTYANEYKALGKRPSIHDFIGSSASLLQPTAVLSPGSSFHQIWVIKRRYGMCSGWSRFIPLVSNYERDSQMIPTTVSYCPVLDESPTTYTTVYKVLKYLQSMMSQVGQDSSVITFDLAIYMKAREIKFRERDEFQDVVIRLGGFHIALNYLGVIGKCYESSGIEDLLIESGLYGASTTECVLKGKHYSRGVRTHRLLYEVILGMLWESFVNSGVTEPADIALFEENMHQDHANLATADVVSVMDAFRHYREKTGERSQLSKFWIQYLDMVEVLFDFIMAERMSEWEDHLDATKRMIPYFAAMSRPNYARWLPVYALDMATLAEQFPDVYHAFTVGKSHTVSRTGQDFSAVWTDMALEQTINYDSKTKGGLVGFSRNLKAVERWLLTSHISAKVTRAFQDCSIHKAKSHVIRDSTPARVKKDLADVNKMRERFSDGTFKNPFSDDDEGNLQSISTGKILPRDQAIILCDLQKIGEASSHSFVGDRLLSEKESFWQPSKQPKVKTFAFKSKSSKKKNTNQTEQVSTVSSDRTLLARLLVASQTRDIDLGSFLSYEMSTYPYSLAHYDGSMRKTTKSNLMTELELFHTETDEGKQNSVDPTTVIFDGMATIQMVQGGQCNSFGELALCYMDIFCSPLQRKHVTRVDVVFDQYWSKSIKGSERVRRSNDDSSHEIALSTAKPIPKQWKKYIANPLNKKRLQTFLTSQWVANKAKLSANTQLVVGGSDPDGKDCVCITSEGLSSLIELQSNHEEADTRILLHAKQASTCGYKQVVIASPDTDVFILAIAFQAQISSTLFFQTGTKDKKRELNVMTICESLPEGMATSLIGLHTLSGCDSTSSLNRKGKKGFFDMVKKSTSAMNILSDVGKELITAADPLVSNLEKSVLLPLYNSTRATADHARYELFCTKNQKSELLPPTTDSWSQHVLRSNFQSYIWKQSLIPMMNLQDPLDNGWELEDASFVPKYMSKPPSPVSVIELTSCACKSNCKSQRCGCQKNKLPCTETCGCGELCENITRHTEDSDTDECDGGFDIANCNSDGCYVNK